MNDPQKAAKTTSAKNKSYEGFTGEERAAMKERARELKAPRRGSRAGMGDGEGEVLAKIAGMAEPDRVLAGRLHAPVRAVAPDLAPRTWYGMPAYAKDGKIVCFFLPPRRSSRPGTRRSASTMQRTSMMAPCGRSLTRSPR